MTTTSTPAVPTPDVLGTPRQTERRAPRGRFSVGRTLKYAALLFFVVIVLIPVYVLLVTSFKGAGDASPARAWALPQVWTLENWQTAWTALSPAILRSLQMVVPAAIIAAFLGSLNGFVLSRWSFKGANVVFTLILFGMFIPYQAVMIPLNQLVLGLGIPSGVPSLILLHVVYGIPITTLIFRNYYMTVPHELVEAARVDGAGMLRTFWSIILPISIPSFVVVLIWQFTSAWNDFLFAVFFSSSQNGPVTLALNNLANGALLQNYGVSMAGALFASLPTLLVYIVLGKYFVGGLMSGSVKG
ncbi:carbohydrate ABC transporter permease [Cellulosimicrobium composti]|uniref:Carbohydrate ABC transporter permease n=1 Tax=Cellulosimicrobium composti TaxID=2672572 RepID=A0ABX0BCB5_9MICO|nr:carbohydrate ABC transporter permease [Cellulosimicrobium composti]NDO89806.1 carbohydrate ABC transporter permease [Cellulosimicrobium composti]TWG86378.1 glucose/mannose transport system permease protein [Cellulosimicrobium cellulans J34]SME88962.1 carbohydrate ABC transporter membrane protein 2, CUT1 family (TC 3.A.1.1.-) [Cellulosimicrobium cellulans J1]